MSSSPSARTSSSAPPSRPRQAQATFAETGKSVAAGRVETALTQSSIEGQGSATASREQAFDNDAGKSVAATRVQHALSDSNV
ncbi:hypothetical protein [Cobetia sp. ICG0124]|uniref:hypothetical protein n=1 Tax=Cobetia sp. ICG0124 TaxID=2053669 RepID=UPI000FD7C5A2|nr:hypothetical protein [Cobetia sp. ICG0124]